MERIDTAIIGGGMTGLAVAYFAADLGLQCTVLERARIGSGASGRNVGMVITGLGEHYARSILNFGRARAREIWEINRRNHRLLRELLAAEEIACEYEQTGSSAVAWDESEAEDIRASIVPLNEDGFPAKLSHGETRNSTELYSPEDAQLHPVRLLEGMAQALRRRKIPILEQSPVLRMDKEEGAYRLELPSGNMFCSRVVLATNAYTPQLLPSEERRITPVRGQCLAVRVPEGFRLQGPHYTDRGHVYWRTYGDLLLIGGFEHLSPDTEHTYSDKTTDFIQRRLENFAREIIDRITVTHRWSGIMGYGFDWFPIIGEVEPGMYIAAGFTGHGFGYAFQAAKWIAESLAGRRAEIPNFLSTRI